MTWMTTHEIAQMRADVLSMLPDTCSILSVAYTRDGEGGLTEVWGTATPSVKCRIDFDTQQSYGREVIVGGAIQPFTRVVLSMPYDTTLATTNRILADGNTYAVKSTNAGQSWIVAVRAELERV